MPLDPTISALFERFPELLTYRVWEKTPEEAREAYRKLCNASDAKDLAIGKSERLRGAGPGGSTHCSRLHADCGGGPTLPAIVYFHGGGFVMGDLDTHDALCRTLANESGCRVFSVDYRLAPEFPFPAAIDDGFAALKWVEENASALAIDPYDIAVAGDSAGGNIAAVMCLLAKANRNSPRIAFQVLFYPSIALTRSFSPGRSVRATVSMIARSSGSTRTTCSPAPIRWTSACRPSKRKMRAGCRRPIS